MTDPTPPAPNYQPQPYAPYGTTPDGAPLAPRTNTLAIVALILSLVGVSLGGVICGHIALGQIKRTGESGHGLALAGVIIGYVFLGLTVLFVILYIGFFALLFGTAGITSTNFS